MNVLVKIHGHQVYREVRGEVLLWATTVEPFGDNFERFAVPCVLVHTGNQVVAVSLKTASTWAEIEVVQEP